MFAADCRRYTPYRIRWHPNSPYPERPGCIAASSRKKTAASRTDAKKKDLASVPHSRTKRSGCAGSAEPSEHPGKFEKVPCTRGPLLQAARTSKNRFRGLRQPTRTISTMSASYGHYLRATARRVKETRASLSYSATAAPGDILPPPAQPDSILEIDLVPFASPTRCRPIALVPASCDFILASEFPLELAGATCVVELQAAFRCHTNCAPV